MSVTVTVPVTFRAAADVERWLLALGPDLLARHPALRDRLLDALSELRRQEAGT